LIIHMIFPFIVTHASPIIRDMHLSEKHPYSKVA
jgi:hypothetical protein